MHAQLEPLTELNAKQQVDIWTATLYSEQALLFEQIENIYQTFDEKIEQMAEEKLDITLKVQFIELYYFVLYQELLVLSKFEEPHKLLLESMDETADKMKQYEEEIKNVKHNFREQFHDEVLLDGSGKIIDTELFFKAIGT